MGSTRLAGTIRSNESKPCRGGRIRRSTYGCQRLVPGSALRTQARSVHLWLAVCGIQRPELAAGRPLGGLVANPDDWGLRNNLTVALAFLGEVESAKQELAKINPRSISEDRFGIYVATIGLVAFRSGQIEAGRKGYQDAVALFDESRSPLTALCCHPLGERKSSLRTPNSPVVWARAQALSSRSEE